jgi:hypothetical protein
MIVQPASTNPRGPVRRTLRIVGLTVPPLLLVLFVGAGLAGPKPEPAIPEASQLAVAPSLPTPTAPSRQTPAGPISSFPTVAANLEVLSVPAAKPRLAAPSGQPIAVAGYLSDVSGPAECAASEGDARRLLSPLCERDARLIVADRDATDARAHLHVRIPPGVRLPPAFEDADPDDLMPVVLVGRTEDPDAPCTTSTRGCGERFVADLVSWADGAPFDPGPVVDAGLRVPLASSAYRRLDEAKTLATGWSGTVLVAAIVRPQTVVEIDPAAAAAMATGPRPGELVWYVRALETGYDPTRYPLGYAPPRLSWAVIDETTGATLARGPAADPGVFPSTVSGLPVLGVPEALEARRAGLAPGVVAVAGWLRAWADPQDCTHPIDGLPGGGCPRAAMLVGGPWTDRPSSTSSDVGPHLHGVVPPGVLIPDRAVGLAVAGLGPPPPVVVIGRFGASETGCTRDLRGCDEQLTIEAVVWSSGRNLSAGRQVAAGLVAPVDVVATSVTDPEVGPPIGLTRLLRVVLAQASDLAALDPAAASVLGPAALGPSVPVWYVRGLTADGPAIDWAVVEPGTGRVLARDDAG